MGDSILCDVSVFKSIEIGSKELHMGYLGVYVSEFENNFYYLMVSVFYNRIWIHLRTVNNAVSCNIEHT